MSVIPWEKDSYMSAEEEHKYWQQCLEECRTDDAMRDWGDERIQRYIDEKLDKHRNAAVSIAPRTILHFAEASMKQFDQKIILRAASRIFDKQGERIELPTDVHFVKVWDDQWSDQFIVVIQSKSFPILKQLCAVQCIGAIIHDNG